jgi:beta-lactamase superfamily II metal-dependent hydrolase
MTDDRRLGRREGRGPVAGGEPPDLLAKDVPVRRGGRTVRVSPTLAVLLGAATVVGAVLVARHAAAPVWPPPGWSLAVCDIGQGDALLLHVGPAEAVAVDTGPDPDREDACLHRFGITELARVVLTHFHADHIGGLTGLLRGRQAAEIETTTVDDPPAGAAEVRRIAAAAGVPVVRVRPGEQTTIGPVSWRVLWPDASLAAEPAHDGPGAAAEDAPPGSYPGAYAAADPGSTTGSGMDSDTGSDGGGEGSGPNNTSIVMAVRIAYPGGVLRILLTGDIETPVQQTLLAEHSADLRADVLKVPHHGSANQDPQFIAAVGPAATVISVGAGNPYGHPAPRTVRLMTAGGAREYRTDLDGDVAVSAPRSPGAAFSVAAARGTGADAADLPSPASTPPHRSRGTTHRHARPKP